MSARILVVDDVDPIQQLISKIVSTIGVGQLHTAKNGAEAMTHQTEKQLEEFGDKVGEEEKNAITTAADELKAVKDGEDAAEIQAKTQALAIAIT